MNKEIYREGRLSNGLPFSVAGRAHNGEAYSLNQNIDVIGQDVSLVLPECNVVAVFDGAGGTRDIGSPLKAAITAADATSLYFHRRGENLSEAMEYARQVVTSDTESGLCVGSIARFVKGRVTAVTAGDTSMVIFNTKDNVIADELDQQADLNSPTNFLGRPRSDMFQRKADSTADFAFDQSSDELYMMSDGAFGSTPHLTSLQEYHFQAAHSDYPILQAAIDEHPEIEVLVRNELRGDKAKQLKDRQLHDSTNAYGEGGWYSPELDHPSSFSLSRFDWDVWDKIVGPIISRIEVNPKLGAKALAMSLLDRRISWEFERPNVDDSTLVVVNPITKL